MGGSGCWLGLPNMVWLEVRHETLVTDHGQLIAPFPKGPAALVPPVVLAGKFTAAFRIKRATCSGL